VDWREDSQAIRRLCTIAMKAPTILTRQRRSGESSDHTTVNDDVLVNTDKSFWDRLWPVMTYGAGLFSDGCESWGSYFRQRSL
jgi:hypothetical protein